MKFTARLLFVPLFIGLFFFTLPLVWNTDAQARDMKEMSLIIKKPIIIKGGLSERMNVSFPHSRHKNVNCLTCHHHKTSNDERYVPCRECHATPGPRERDPMSMFMAFHAKENTRSCYGCHLEKRKQNPAKFDVRFRGCLPCHRTPGAREASATNR